MFFSIVGFTGEVFNLCFFYLFFLTYINETKFESQTALFFVPQKTESLGRDVEQILGDLIHK